MGTIVLLALFGLTPFDLPGTAPTGGHARPVHPTGHAGRLQDTPHATAQAGPQSFDVVVYGGTRLAG